MTQTAQFDAVRFLRVQHDLVRQLFATVANGNGEQRRESFNQLVRLLAVHETAEEMVVYPSIRQAENGEKVATARLAEEDKAKKTLSDLETLEPTTSEFLTRFTTFRAAVEAHADSEEREVFPLLQACNDEQQLRRMTAALKVAEAMAPTHPHKNAPTSAVGNALVGPFVAIVDRVRDAIKDATT